MVLYGENWLSLAAAACNMSIYAATKPYTRSLCKSIWVCFEMRT